MSFIPKLQTALGVAFILTTAGAISVMAQTQAAADESLTKTIANSAPTPAPTNELKKAESTTPSTTPSEKLALVTTAEIIREEGNPNVLAASTSTSAPASQPAIPSPQTVPADEWQFQLTPYLWLPAITGRAGIGNFVVEDVSANLGDSSLHLNFGFMGTLEARKGKLVILTDLQYSNIGADSGTPGPGFSGVETDFKTFILDPEIGYRVVDNPDKGAFVDVLGGIRYWHLKTDLDFLAGILSARSVTASRDWVDAVVGIRGKTHLSKKWFVSGKGDLGGGGSKFTYQLFGGVGVMVSQKVALIGGYRALHTNYDRDNFLFDMTLHGPLMGVGFKF